MNFEKLKVANDAGRAVEYLETLSERVDGMREAPDSFFSFDFPFAELSVDSRKQILAIAQADIDARLRDAKAAFEAL